MRYIIAIAILCWATTSIAGIVTPDGRLDNGTISIPNVLAMDKTVPCFGPVQAVIKFILGNGYTLISTSIDVLGSLKTEVYIKPDVSGVILFYPPEHLTNQRKLVCVLSELR